MSLKVTLASKSTKKWVTSATANEMDFLRDHADVERKAGAFAMTMVSKYPQHEKVTSDMIDVVIDHYQNFRSIYKEVAKKKGKLNREINKDLYITKMLMVCRNGRKERFLDRLIVGAIMATRTAERLSMFATATGNAILKKLYTEMATTSMKHAALYLSNAGKYFKDNEIKPRLQELVKEEAKVAAETGDRPALH